MLTSWDLRLNLTERGAAVVEFWVEGFGGVKGTFGGVKGTEVEEVEEEVEEEVLLLSCAIPSRIS